MSNKTEMQVEHNGDIFGPVCYGLDFAAINKYEVDARNTELLREFVVRSRMNIDPKHKPGIRMQETGVVPDMKILDEFLNQ